MTKINLLSNKHECAASDNDNYDDNDYDDDDYDDYVVV